MDATQRLPALLSLRDQRAAQGAKPLTAWLLSERGGLDAVRGAEAAASGRRTRGVPAAHTQFEDRPPSPGLGTAVAAGTAPRWTENAAAGRRQQQSQRQEPRQPPNRTHIHTLESLPGVSWGSGAAVGHTGPGGMDLLSL